MKQKYANPPHRYVWRYGDKFTISWRGGVPYVTFERCTRILYEDTYTGEQYINYYGHRVYFQN